MYILAIETTGPKASAALLTAPDRGAAQGGQGQTAVLLGERSSDEAKNHLKNLLPLIRQLLDECGVPKNELTHIAASVGPGSFTGIRIGVATARALAQVLQLPCAAVPTLETFRYAEAGKAEREEPQESDACRPLVCGIINARRGQVYGIVEDCLPGGPYMLTDVLEAITQKALPNGKTVRFYGDGIDAYETQIRSYFDDQGYREAKDYFFAEPEERYQSAAAAAYAALERITDGETVSFEQLLPDYMRKAEAEVKLAAGQLPICRGPKQE